MNTTHTDTIDVRLPVDLVALVDAAARIDGMTRESKLVELVQRSLHMQWHDDYVSGR